MSATLGDISARSVVDPSGSFTVRLRIAAYPDTAARDWHTVVLAALSSALIGGTRESAAVAVQADPMPIIDMVTRAPLVRTTLTIDGTQVPAVVTAPGTMRYQIAYAGHLRAGLHRAYLKWSDASGAYGTRLLSFRIGSPYADMAAPSLSLGAYTIHLGELLGVAGSPFTPDATIAVTLGGPNTPPGSHPYGKAVVDSTGQFRLTIRLAGYPDANARQSGVIEVSVAASGAAVGDLPEAVAAPVKVTP